MIAQKLLMKTISQASHEKAIACWSYPKQSVEQVRGAMDEGVTGQQVMNMLFMTQHYDRLAVYLKME